MRAITASLLCCLLAACATAESAPTARTLTEANIAAIGATRVSVTANETGVAKSWYYTETNGGSSAGLAGAIGAAIAGAIINAAPSARAHRQASEVAELQTAAGLDTSLVDHLKLAGAAQKTSAPAITPSEIVVTQKMLLDDPASSLDDTLEVTTSYTLSEDSSVLRIAAVATYANKAMPYQTRYTFEKVPYAEKKGPLYRNSFTYYSTPLPVPTLTPELKTRLVASTEDSFRDDAGALPAKGSSQYSAMERQIELARDDKLTPTELSVFLTREWLKDDGALLKREISNAHDFVSKYVLLDVNRSEIPSLKGEDELLETTADERTVRRMGTGAEAGSYVSSAANVEGFATYGNTVAIGKATAKYIDGLKDKSGYRTTR